MWAVLLQGVSCFRRLERSDMNKDVKCKTAYMQNCCFHLYLLIEITNIIYRISLLQWLYGSRTWLNAWHIIAMKLCRNMLMLLCIMQGFKSIYKPKRQGAHNFAELLDQVAAIDPEMRTWYTSPHPKDFSDDVLDVNFHPFPSLASPSLLVLMMPFKLSLFYLF